MKLYGIPEIKFCIHCGHAIEQQTPEGDNHPRAVCPACGLIQYQNPINIVGTVAMREGKILLCKRNIEPKKGLWTLPAGFLELGESIAQGARRETIEESGASFELKNLYLIINLVQAGQVHFFYRAELLSDQFSPGIETMEAKLFAPEDIPWDKLAFLTTKKTLEICIQDMKEAREKDSFHEIDIELPSPT